MVSTNAVSHTGFPLNQPRCTIMDIFAEIAKRDLKTFEPMLKANPELVNQISPAFMGNHGPGDYPGGVRALMWATFVLRDASDVPFVSAILNAMAAYALKVSPKDPVPVLNDMLNEIDIFAGRTALHWAAHNDNRLIYKMIEAFAASHKATLNYNQRDNGGKTATQVALSKGYHGFAADMAPARLKNAGSGPVHLAIIGMGATGTALFIRLVRGIVEAPAVYPPGISKNITFSLIDSKATLGRGMAYSDELNSVTSILNVHAAGMSIDSTDPADFLNHIKKNYLEGNLAVKLGEAGYQGLTPVAPPNPTGYYPRIFFGEYCSERLKHWIEVAEQSGITVNIRPCTVVSHVSKPDAKTGLMTVELKGSEFGDPKLKGTKTGDLQVTHTFNSTGHWEHKITTPKPYEVKIDHGPCCINFPASRKTLTDNGVFDKPAHVAVMGSSLSAIDAVFAVLLHPKVGHLEWVGSTPRYVPHYPATPWRVTCYSRRGVWPKVRPSDNRDVDAQWTSPAMYEFVRQVFNDGKGPDLNTCLTLLDNELAAIYQRPRRGVTPQPGEKKPLPTALDLTDPLKLLPPDVKRDPWALVTTDVRECDDGDSGSCAERPWVRWYQVIHGLFPVLARAYRGWSPEDRARFDKEINTPFLWAFAPMPLHSARVLLAMHQAGVLNLYATPDKETPVLSTDKKHFDYPYFHPETGKRETNAHEFLAVTIGLGSDVRLDSSELTASDLAEGKFTLKDQEADDPKSENTVFLANDDSYEFVDVHGQHSPARRGVGFFTHGSYFTIQAVPAVVGHTRNAAELYLAEFIARLTGDPLKALPTQKPFEMPKPDSTKPATDGHSPQSSKL